MIKQFAICFLILSNSILFAQFPASVHQQHILEFGQTQNTSPGLDNNTILLPLQSRKHSILSKKVFGYLPYWEYSTAHANIRYDMLSHLAAFDFAVSKTGNVSNPSGWPWSTVINTAHQNGVKVIMCVTNFVAGQIDSIMKISSVKQNFISQVKTKIGQYNLDGLNIDFEGMASANRGSVFVNFLKEVSDSVKATYPFAEISIAAPSITSGYAVAGIVAACDYIFIMGYDFYGSWSSQTGPSAPLLGGTYNITNTINTQYAAVINSMPQKLLLGVPYYGNKWKAASSAPHATVKKYMNSTRFSSDQPASLSYGLLWAGDNQTPWYQFPADTGYYQIWFDNDSSLGLKYTLAKTKNLGGVGIWALGYDGSRQELWYELLVHFQGNSVSQDAIMEHPNYQLIRNYPNPFNPETTIDYKVSESGRVQLHVYDVVGKLVAELVDEDKDQGNYSVKLDGANLSSGVYFGVLFTPTGNSWIKMVLMK